MFDSKHSICQLDDSKALFHGIYGNGWKNHSIRDVEAWIRRNQSLSFFPIVVIIFLSFSLNNKRLWSGKGEEGYSLLVLPFISRRIYSESYLQVVYQTLFAVNIVWKCLFKYQFTAKKINPKLLCCTQLQCLCLCWRTHVCVICNLLWCLLIVNPELNRKENIAFKRWNRTLSNLLSQGRCF